ncbi:MAG: NUDIX domain-containing protein [Endomicrobium sp.]|jgi:8-oxo-dGTP pyrophosphatase MutT (NUDIX family)|nr:NUDIX domain-containing protein [Endomicrobium sp.]
MHRETSCGAVIYKIQDNSSIPLFLLVNSKRNGVWGFPKGHMESGETEIETASREIFEETGIKKIKFIDGFKYEDRYIISGSVSRSGGLLVKKICVYFLALALQDIAGFDENEISKLEWADIHESQKLLSFYSQRKIIKLAYNKIIGG